MNLQIAKWGNSLAVRIPADYVRQMGVQEGDMFEVRLGSDGALNLKPPAQWSRKAFAAEMAIDLNSGCTKSVTSRESPPVEILEFFRR